jgi:drug/metabolite transporter (DMT)-like permease
VRQRLTLALIAVAALWGLTFPLVQDAVEEIPTLRFLGMRFLIAAIALGFAFRRADRRTMRAGTILGLIWGGGYIAQTLGLRTSTATNVAFITGMYVVLTPLLVGAVTRKAPTRPAIVGVVLAAVGLAALASPTGLTFASGDLLALACAVLFAGHIVGIGIAAPDVDPIALTAVQSLVASVMCFAAGAFGERGPWEMPSGANIGVLLITGVGASAIALIVQTRAQQVLAATPVAVILTMESVFGGVFGYLLAGDRLALSGWVGAALIITGVLVAATVPSRRATDPA